MSYTDQDFETTAASHTPGPWVVNDRFYVCTAAPTPEFIADCATDSSVEREYAIDEANARLIAASPDMLDALYLARSFAEEAIHGDRRWHAEVSAAIDAAIAKAEGR